LKTMIQMMISMTMKVMSIVFIMLVKMPTWRKFLTGLRLTY